MRETGFTEATMKKQNAILIAVQLIDIHGSRFYDIALELENGRAKNGRLGVESVYADPQIGDNVRVSLLLGEITSVEKAE